MKCLVVGASGTIGKAVAEGLAAAGHEVVKASRNGEVKLDISDPASIKGMYESVGKADAVVSCAGSGAFAPLTELSDEQLEETVRSKLIGQVNLVRFGVDHLSDGGVFVLTSGIFSRTPPPGVPALAMANGGVESFAIAAAKDLPRGIRIGCMCPPFITETAQAMGLPTDGTLSAADNAEAYVAYVGGDVTGEVVLTAAR